jgi:CHAD domain-containing protein
LSAALAVESDPSDREALRALLLAQLQLLAGLERDVLAEDAPDALRRFRVAARRIRALLRAARPLVLGEWSEPLRAELAWLGRALGPARDLDVLLAHIRAVSAGFEPGERFALARALRQLEDERAEARRDVAAALGSERYHALRERLERELPAPRLRPSLLSTADLAAAEVRRLRKAYRALGGVASDEELHSLRLRVKRARYAAELAEHTAGKALTRFEARAKTVQGILGEHQDATVAEARIRALLNRPQSVRWAVAAGRLIERQALRREAARLALPEAWLELEKAARAAFPPRRR